MRLRTDSAHIAGWQRAHALRGCHCGPELLHVAHDPDYDDTPPAEPGDAWVFLRPGGSGVMGYALTCPDPTCEQGVHAWTHASGCTERVGPYHMSCWTWTGSAEDGTLTANPSLAVTAGCMWHGWLRDGEMVSV